LATVPFSREKRQKRKVPHRYGSPINFVFVPSAVTTKSTRTDNRTDGNPSRCFNDANATVVSATTVCLRKRKILFRFVWTTRTCGPWLGIVPSSFSFTFVLVASRPPPRVEILRGVTKTGGIAAYPRRGRSIDIVIFLFFFFIVLRSLFGPKVVIDYLRTTSTR